MIQDIFPKVFDNHYDSEAIAFDDDIVLVFNNDEIMIGDATSVGGGAADVNMSEGEDASKTIACFPRVSDLINVDNTELRYLFAIDEKRFFLLQKCVAAPVGFSYQKFRTLRERNYRDSKDMVFAAFTAYQLNEWYAVTRYCGRCGALNEDDKSERARVCPECGNKIYPRINPAVIIGITDKETDRIILTKYRTGFGHNALVAGFTEIGETLEGTVAREAMEEVGLKVTNIRYYKSQPWGIASDILAGFFCDVEGDPAIKMDSSELKYAEWVAPEDIVLQPVDYSLTNEMMRLFKEKGYEGTLGRV